MSRGKTCLVILLSMLAIVSIFPTSVIPKVRIPNAHAASHAITLKGASFNGWNGTNPGPTITVVAGDSVTMSLLSTDGYSHTFVIDVGKTGISGTPNCAVDKCSPSFYSTTAPTAYPFTVDFGPGIYTYYCSIHLAMMMGTFTVIASGPDYRISSSPASLTVTAGSHASTTITITGSNGFSGSIGLSATVPSGAGTATLNPASVTLSSTKTSTTSILTISSALGKFNATVTAASGSTSHSINVLVNGPDFTVTTSPTSLNLNQGSSGTLIVTLSGIDGFSGSVSLTANPSSVGLTTSLSSNTLQVPTTGTVTSTLTVTASSSGAYSTAISPGSYNTILNATMGSLSHSATIPLTVTSPSFGAGILTSPLFIGGIVGTIAVVGVAAYLLSRRAKRLNAR